MIPVLVGGCSLSRPLFDDPHRTPYPAHFPELPQGPSLDVLVMGDWGTGGPGQRRVSRAIEDAYRFDPPDLVLSTGDNFYPHG
ncbi:MAG TPA: hypothetical protein VLA43_07205, partial [Longimicrobiales bacterium]|nr:hypothetical protein [Longimicrobiales bacterium]